MCNEQTDGRHVFRALCARNTGRCLKIQTVCSEGCQTTERPVQFSPLTDCFQPATQAKLQASATYLSDACAGTGHVAGPLATHWLMFRSRVDRRYWSTLVVAPKCSMIKREETVMWLNLFIACNKAVRSASTSYTCLLVVKRVKRASLFGYVSW